MKIGSNEKSLEKAQAQVELAKKTVSTGDIEKAKSIIDEISKSDSYSRTQARIRLVQSDDSVSQNNIAVELINQIPDLD